MPLGKVAQILVPKMPLGKVARILMPKMPIVIVNVIVILIVTENVILILIVTENVILILIVTGLRPALKKWTATPPHMRSVWM